VHWIRAEIHEFILRNWRIVKVATTKAQRKLFFNLRSKKTRLAWLTQSELENIASDLGVKPSEVLEMESRLSGQDIGFDAPSSDNDTEHTLSAPEAYLSNNEDPASLTEKNDFMKHQLEQLTAGLDCLDSRSREIVRARWLDEEKATLHQLANKYNVSAERIRQLESNALKKLQGSIVA
jgi:RNA polymerase sigma-32 factor